LISPLAWKSFERKLRILKLMLWTLM